MRWNRRSGGVAAAGGRATQGISTSRKRRACRRNLKVARESKAMRKVKTETDHSVSLLRAARQAEIAQAEAAAAASRALLMDREAQILADPLLRQVYALLKRPQAVDAEAMRSTAAERSLGSPCLGTLERDCHLADLDTLSLL